jgi:NAD(P)-dependent dehydrogenase (short-subunit alcohol dehydrogenase family)
VVESEKGPEMDLKDVSAVVTGGASGLGEATVRALSARGAVVTILDMDEDAGAAVATDIGGDTTFVRTDVTDPAQVSAAVAEAAGKGRPLRLAVNCAGVGWASRLLSRRGEPHDLELFTKVVMVNLVGTFNVMRLAAAEIARSPELDGHGRGVIVNTASIAAYEGQIGQVAYAASKSGVVGMTLPAARDLAGFGIRVCTVAPGIIDTPMLAGVSEEVRTELAAGVPFPQRLGTPAEYAALVVFLAEHDYLNGETVRMDAALRMAPR